MRFQYRHWAMAFGVATFVILVLGAHTYLISIYNQDTSKAIQQFLKTICGWYLWALFFPFILHLANDFSFTRGRRFQSTAAHVFAGATFAAIHAVFQIFINDWLFDPARNWRTFKTILQTSFVTSFLWRFFMYQALLTVCLALNSYRRAREMEMQALQIESGIVQAEIEALQIKVDPEFLFDTLKRLSTLMHTAIDEADTLIAQLGDYLRLRLDRSNISEALHSEPLTIDRAEARDFKSTVVGSDSPSSIVQKWLLITAIFTGLAAYFTVQRAINHYMTGTRMDWPQQLLDTSGWYIWALLTPIILKLSKTFPLEEKRWLRNGSIHFVAFLSSWAVATVLYTAVRWAGNFGQVDLQSIITSTLAKSPLSLDIVCYSTIVAIESALRYHKRFEAGKIRTIRLASQLTRARLEVLKMQLHPHFLFNALNSLSELMQEDSVAAEEMIRNLEGFLRITMGKDQTQEISFERELELLHCYLSIEHIRYQNRLNVKMDIEPQVMKIAVPNLVMQPIVENAIRHGIASRSSPGQIEIQAKRINGILKLSVRDNGPGLNRKGKIIPVRSGLGLSNTKERLLQLYGKNHRFELVNAPEGGLIVTLEIPAGREVQ